MAELTTRRLIAGNLDAEVELSRSTSGVAPTLRTAVVERISAAAGALSVFGTAGDLLWTPAPLDPARLPDDAPRPISGALASPPAALLAWCETPRMAALRREAAAVATAADWRERVWQLAPPVEAARACNDRRFGHRLAVELDAAPAGARLIESVAELEAVLAAGAPPAWVVKAPMSASGRDRVRRRGGELTADVRVRIERLLDRGPLLYEPWLDRVVDVGVVGLVTDDGCLRFPPHRLEVDDGGVFRAITLCDDGDIGLTDGERDRLDQVVDRVGRALREATYVGPFGVDAFVYRDPSGRRGLVPLCEINARLTFGHVARALAERLGLGGRAHFGLSLDTAPAGAHVIVRPAPPDRLTAWIAPGPATPGICVPRPPVDPP